MAMTAETSTGVLLAIGSLALNDYDKFTIVIGEREVEWWHKDILLAAQAIPTAQGIPVIAPSAPIFMMKHMSGVVSNTNVVRFSRVGVTLMDIETDRAWQHSRAIAGRKYWVTDEELDGLLVQALAAPQEMAQDAPEQPVASDRDEEGAEIAAAHLRASASRQLAALLRDAETAAQRYELLMRALQDEVAQSLLRLEYERMRFEEDEEDIALLLLH